MRTIFLAGIGNSEHDHWQRHWHRHLGDSVWVEHDDWDRPVCERWVADLQEVVSSTPGPKRLVAHSLGCLVAAAWAYKHRDASVTDALLVAVPDPEGPNFPREASGFAPLRREPLPLRATAVASSDDPYGSLAHARETAAAWTIPIVEVGAKGHLNLSSGLGFWDEGWNLLESHHGGGTASARGGTPQHRPPLQAPENARAT